MRISPRLVVAALAVAGATIAVLPSAASAAPKIKTKAVVDHVADGDTIKVAIGRKEEYVRFIGIDTPEVHNEVECGGPEASASMDRLLHPGDEVKLVRDRTQDNRDSYDRLLRYVEFKGRDVGQAQVKKGWAEVFVFDQPYSRLSRYSRAETRAKAGGHGVWGQCGAFESRAASAQEADYVALGDSYAAGTGTTDAYAGLCFDNTPAAYGALIDPKLPGTGANVACGGAVSGNIDTDEQYDRPPQLDRPEIGSKTKFVSLQIGGNDIGFINIVAACLVQPDCSPSIDAAEQTAKTDLPPKLNRVYDAVRAKAPDAQVVVVGYPRLVDPAGCGTISPTEADRLNRGADTLRDQIKALAQAHGFAFADPIDAFNGHGACGADPWLNGVAPVFVNSFHPNVTGHVKGYAPVVLATFRSIPDTKIKGKPKAKRGRRKYKVRLAGSETARTFECALDGAAFQPCQAKAKLKHLKRGKHLLQARAVNADGDVDQSPASKRFKVRKPRRRSSVGSREPALGFEPRPSFLQGTRSAS